jgi:hypothetical protein
MKVYPNGTDDAMELELEQFTEGVVDIIRFDYPSSWSDSTVLDGLDLAEADLNDHGVSVKNMGTWRNRYAH